MSIAMCFKCRFVSKKSMLFVLLFLLILPSKVLAQGELFGTYGILSPLEINRSRYLSSIARVLSESGDRESRMYGMGPFALGYKLPYSDNVDWGGSVAFSTIVTTISANPLADQATWYKSEVVNTTNVALMGTMSYYWFEIDNLEIYSKGFLGANFRTHRNLTTDKREFTILPTFQVTPLGMRLGGALGAFIEVGYGANGVSCIGISYRFCGYERGRVKVGFR